MDNKSRQVRNDVARLQRSLRTISRCNRELFHARGEQALLQAICQILVETAEVGLAWIGYCEDDAEKTVRPVASAGNGVDYLQRVQHSWAPTLAGRGPVGEAIRTGNRCWVKDTRTDPMFSHGRTEALALGYVSCVALPLVAKTPSGDLLDLRSALTLYAGTDDAFEESEIELYAEVASYLACTISRLRSHLADDVSHGVRALLIRGERKRVEEALRSSEDRLWLVINTIPTIAWSSLPDGSWAFVNQPWSEYTGLPAKDSAGSGWQEAFHPEDIGSHVERWGASLATGGPFENEARVRRAADGEYRWFLIHGRPLRDDSGKIVRWYGTATDIEDRKRAEQALQRSEAYLAEAQKISHTGSWAYDVANRRMTYSSEEHHRLFGFDPAAGMPGAGDWVRRIHPDDREKAIQAMEQTIRDRRDYELEHRVVHTDGTIRFIHTVGHPVSSPSGHVAEVVGTSTDITDRKREEYLTEQVSERLPDLISIIGRDYRYRRANPTYERVWRIPPEKVVGMHIGDIIGREIFGRVVKPNLDRCFAGQQVSFAEWFDNPGGRRYWVVTYSPLKLESEQVDAALAVARDLTEQTMAAEKLRDAQIELAHVNRVATVGQLTTSIAHEVNQPIGALVTNAYAASRMLRARPPDLDEISDALGAIIKDGRRVSDVIQRVRALVKKAPAQADQLDINEVIIETVALAHSEILRNDVALQTQLAKDLPPIRGDRVQLQQVIMNLVMNAVESMSAANEGSRELQIGTDKDIENSISITVTDSGPVLTPESLNRFFEAFYSTKPTGMGIGLSICRSIIEAHEGRIWATANVPRGAALHITLPILRSSALQ
jgi:PAS domain S-box-containing protein